MILEKAADLGVNVINNPSNLRNLNEKIFALNFPKFCPPTLITSDFEIFNSFLKENDISRQYSANTWNPFSFLMLPKKPILI